MSDILAESSACAEVLSPMTEYGNEEPLDGTPAGVVLEWTDAVPLLFLVDIVLLVVTVVVVSVVV